jgi:hypothetical protein
MARREDYIPVSDIEMRIWLATFAEYVPAHLDELGLKAEQIVFLADEKAEFDDALADHEHQRTLALAATARKRAARAAIESHLRPIVRMIGANPDVTNDVRGFLGLRPLTGHRVRREVGREAPGLRVVPGSGMVAVHFGTSPGNEQRNGKPRWALGCNIYRRDDDESDFRLVAFATASPYYDPITKGLVQATYVARYLGRRNGEMGPQCAAISVAAGSPMHRGPEDRLAEAA